MINGIFLYFLFQLHLSFHYLLNFKNRKLFLPHAVCWEIIIERVSYIGPSGTELNPICHLLALLEAYCNL